MDNSQWFIARNRTREGPHTSTELGEMAAVGTLQPTDMVLACGATKWQPASTVPDLFPPPLPLPPAAPAADEAPPLPPELAQPDYFIAVAGQRQGPFSLAQLQSQDLRPETPIWKRGMPQWVRAAQLPEVNELLIGGMPAVLSPTRSAARRPWNPLAVAWLGLLFSPGWCGVMTALNNRRLGLSSPSWRPLGVGFGALGLILLIGLVLDVLVIEVLVYGSAVALIWYVDLRAQQEPYIRFQAQQAGGKENWVGPALAGVPLAALTVLAFVVIPLLPLSPREVCERFNRATTAQEMARYTTGNLVPALEALAKSEETGDVGHFELTGDEAAPPDVGGHLVAFRLTSVEAGERLQMEGLFHLVKWSGSWKIEEIYFAAVNRQPLERWLALSSDYRWMVSPNRSEVVPASAAQSGKQPVTKYAPTAWSNTRAHWKALGFLIVLACLALGKLLDKLEKKQMTNV